MVSCNKTFSRICLTILWCFVGMSLSTGQTNSNNADTYLTNEEASKRAEYLFDTISQLRRVDSSFLEEYETVFPLLRDTLRKAQFHYTLGRAYYETSRLEECTTELLKANHLNQTIEDEQLMGSIWHYLSMAYFSLSRLDSSKYFGSKALTAYTNLGDSSKIASTLNTLGSVYGYSYEISKGIENLEQAQLIWKKLGNVKARSKALSNIGVMYRKAGLYSKALEYYLESLAAKEKIKDENASLHTLLNIANIYLLINEHEKAENSYRDIIKRSEKFDNYEMIAWGYSNLALSKAKSHQDSAVLFNHMAIEYARKAQMQRIESMSYHNLANTYTNMSRYDSATKYARLSISLSEHLDDLGLQSSYLIAFANIKLQTKQLSEAKALGQTALKYASDIASSSHLKDAHLLLHDVYQELYDHKQALHHYKLFEAHKDSLTGEEQIKAIGKIETQYAIKEKKRENLLLLQEKEIKEKELLLQKAQISRQKILIVGSLVFLFIALLILYLLVNSYRKKQKQISMLLELNKESREKRDEMIDYVRSLKVLNKDHEKRLYERSEEIQRQSQKLAHYRFINSHNVRSPLAKILGIIDIVKSDASIDLSLMVDQLHKSSVELDHIIREVGQRLSEEESSRL